MTSARSATDQTELGAWLEDRNKALMEMDYAWCRNQVGRHASDELCELSLHKARYECTMIPAEARHASAAWLRERGYGRITGTPILPEGELPK